MNRVVCVVQGALWLALVLAGGFAARAGAAEAGNGWVATWAQAMTSNFACVATAGTRPAALSATCDAASERAPALRAATLRQVVHTSIGGDEVRIRLTNYFDQIPLRVSAARVALAGGSPDGLDIAPASDRKLTFAGKGSVTIAPGTDVMSDPVRLRVPALADVVVSLYFAGTAQLADVHLMEHAMTAAAVSGDVVSARSLRRDHDVLKALGAGASGHVYVLDEVDVAASAGTRGIVAFGDSITDGAYATGPDMTWPGVLARLANTDGNRAGVVNMGISGNELTVDQLGNPGYGVSALKRFERDVIDRAGVTDVVVLLGTNDLNRGTDPAGYASGASFGAIVNAYRMLVDVAHAHGLKVYAGTITPFAGFPDPDWYTPAKEAIRERTNRWIRTMGVFDGVIDFSLALAGTYQPSPLAAQRQQLPPGLASVCAGDAGLHPNDRGYAVMGTLAYDLLFDRQLKPAHACH